MPLRMSCSRIGRLARLRFRAQALAAIVLLTALGSRAEAAAPPGQWWNAAYAERLKVTVTGRGAAAPAQYSMYVTIDHARMVSTGRSLASGDDVRVVYWNGGGWVELDRRLDDQDAWNTPHTGIWFRTQAPVGAYATDDNYYIYYNNPAAGAPPTSWANVFLFYDDFSAGALDTTRWTCTLGTCTQSGGILSLGANSRVQATATYAFGTDTRWECSNRLGAAYAPDNAFDNCGASDVVGWTNDHVVHWVDTANYYWETSLGGAQNNGTYANPAPTTYEVYTIDREGSSADRFFLDNTFVGVRTATIPTSNLRMQMWNSSSLANGIRSDWVRVRRYVTPEPDANARRESTIIGGSCMVVTDIGGGDYDSSLPYWGNDEAHAVTLQSDGKIVVGGFGYVNWATDFVVARYEADFRLDTTFGSAGITNTNVDYDDEAWGVAIQPDGKIVLGGHDRVGTTWTNDDFAVARYDTNGILDPTFNNLGGFGDPPNREGMTATKIGPQFDLGRPMILQDDGKIVLAGAVEDAVGSFHYDFGVARYNADGSLDTAGFGAGTGKVVTSIGAVSDYGNALAYKTDPGGYILVAGASQNADWDFSMARYDLSGALDTSFGGGTGIVVTDLRGGSDWGAAVAVQPDGKIVMAGNSSNGTDTDIAVVRYNADGSLDTSFGAGGMVFTPMGPADDESGGVALQPDGKIVVVGAAQNGSDYDFAVVRYNSDGSLDTSFGFGGKVTTPIGAGDDKATAVALQPDGRIVAVGHSYNALTQDTDFAMVRYNPDGSVDDTCGQVFYSIGTNGGNLATGSPSVTVTSGTATLTAAQTNDVGVGDALDYGSGPVYISAVISPTEFRVQTATGDLPVDTGGSVGVSSITRAFSSIAAAAAGSSDASHLNSSDLVALEKGLTWVCYNDGPLSVSATTTINGYTTSATHFITLTAAGATQVATGHSQRHLGVAGTGSRMERTGGGAATLLAVSVPYTRIEWLELDGKDVATTEGIGLDGAGDHSVVRSVLVHNLTGSPGSEDATSSGVYIDVGNDASEVRNSLVYAYDGDGVHVAGTNAIVANATFYLGRTTPSSNSLQTDSGTASASGYNVLAVGPETDFFENVAGDLKLYNCISTDTSAQTYDVSGSYRTGVSEYTEFVSLTGTVNLHLRGGAQAIDFGTSLASTFNEDVDGQVRPQGAAWDVGADETALSGAGVLYRSVGITATNLNTGSRTVTISGLTATFNGPMPDNVGVGDVLTYASGGNQLGFIAGRTSSTVFTVTDKNGGPPASATGVSVGVYRAYNHLADWESGIKNPNIVEPSPGDVNPSTDLVAAGTVMMVPCYADGEDVGSVYIDGWTTGPGNYIKIYTPVFPTEVGTSQRHNGAWDNSAYRLSQDSSYFAVMGIFEQYVRVDGLQLNANQVVSTESNGIQVDDGNGDLPVEIQISNNIVRSTTAGPPTGAFGIGALNNFGDTTFDSSLYVVKLWNNVVYGFVGSSATTGIYADNYGTVYAYNNTVVGPGTGKGIVRYGNVVFLAKNNISIDFADPYNGTFSSSSTNNFSDQADAPGLNPKTRDGAGADPVFVGGTDYHLDPSDTWARDQGADLSTDANLALTYDIDLTGRQAPWDIGADEVAGTTAVTLLSFGAVPADRAVELEWRTASELDNLGFHLYRSLTERGPWTRITPSLIPGLGSSPLGASYSWRDTGLVNRTRYFYRLEDVDTSSVSTFHGPVSAVPRAATTEDDDSGSSSGDGSGDPGSTAGSLPACSSSPAVLPCVETFGDPSAVSARVVSHSSRGAVVELLTGGFEAVHQADGTVRVSIPGFDDPADPHAPALPIRRVVLDGEVGREARVSSVKAEDEQVYPGLVPAATGYPEMEARADGTVLPARRPASLEDAGGGSLPREAARLGNPAFVGESKRLSLELSPVRFDGSQGALVLTRRLQVQVEFSGWTLAESGSGSRGRRVPRLSPGGGNTLAFLHTREKGLYAVSFEALFPGRTRALSLDLLSLQRQGEAVPFHVEPSSGSFGPGSVLYFYAPRGPESTSYGPEVVYELARATGGEPMEEVSASPFGDVLTTAPLGTAGFETNRIYQAGLLEAEDLWQWEALIGGASKSEEFALSGVDTSATRAGRVEMWLQGGSDADGVVDHHVEVRLNGTYVGETTFDGKRPQLFSADVAAAVFHEGANELTVTNVGDTGVHSLVFLDRFEVDYPQASELSGGVFAGEWSEGGTAQVAVPADPGSTPSPVVTTTLSPSVRASDASPARSPRDRGTRLPVPGRRSFVGSLDAVSAVDVTDPAHPRWLVGLEPGPGSVQLRAEAGRHYELVSPEGVLVPGISSPMRSSLKSGANQADYILIAPEAFLSTAPPLLERRQSQGLVTKAVSLEEIASVFGHGEASGEAIRSFLTYAYQSWQRPSVRYVVLLGDASQDPRNFTGTAGPAPLPALFLKTSYLVTASDPALAAVNGDDLLPDLAIGRLPAQTVEEAQVLVQKVLAWEDTGQGLRGKAVLVADNPDEGGDFEADVADVRDRLLESHDPETILLRQQGSNTRGKILEALDAGASLMSYVGHGGAAVWASENVLNSWDVASLQAQSEQPLMLTMNCLNGYFVAPNFDSLSEAYLKAPGRGTIAAFSPSGLSLDAPAHQLHLALVRELVSGTHERLGDAVLAAQKAYFDSGELPELLAVYHLLGDPGMRIR